MRDFVGEESIQVVNWNSIKRHLSIYNNYN